MQNQSDEAGGNSMAAGTAVLSAQIVSAYVSNNSLQPSALPDLYTKVAEAISNSLKAPAQPEEPIVETKTPAEIKKSITPDALISFLNGRPFKSLRRHLTSHGLTPEQYRQRFGLPNDYPLVAVNYSKARSDLAIGFGLGKRQTASEAA